MQDWEDWELDWKIRRLESQRMSSMMKRIKAIKKREKLLEKHPSKKKPVDPTYFYCFLDCLCVIKIRDIKAVEQSLTLYPNSTIGIIYLSPVIEGSFKLFNEIGRLIDQGKIEPSYDLSNRR